MSLRITQVDAFTAKPYRGNPAAVCVLPEARPAAWMQAVAREMNLSETAFLVGRGDGGYDLRWFTPAVEVALCGHATLASAHVLWETGQLAPDVQARFHTQSGPVTATRRDGGWIELDFPAKREERAATPPGLEEALRVRALYVGKSAFDYLVLVSSEDEVRAARPDFGLLATLPVRGVIVTSRSSSRDFDFVSRFFAPAAGVNEDPVTGSAHCCLTPFWAGRLGKAEMTAYQASARGGVVRVRLRGDRVDLGGQAVTILEGELRAEPNIRGEDSPISESRPAR
ncbi:isomerase [Sorangium cellulosum]|uniref:Isomerase n=1 Tax=Sorangium cellulosum TaxID=56 RepID=A0A2L0EPL7_SORCE|nr:PhzF family phenazine biosynthesis protein [Sorangium cellulosum]AUX41215.1 isomerase [Sorangium cellulosum]